MIEPGSTPGMANDLALSLTRFVIISRSKISFLQLDDRAVGLDRARGDVFDLDIAAEDFAKRDVDLAFRLATALRKDLDADVVRKDQLARFAIIHANFPEEGFGVGVTFNDRRFEGKFCRIDRPPISLRRQIRALLPLINREPETQKAGGSGDQGISYTNYLSPATATGLRPEQFEG